LDDMYGLLCWLLTVAVSIMIIVAFIPTLVELGAHIDIVKMILEFIQRLFL